MRTFSQDAWTSALEQWKSGDFSDEWKPYRHQAAMRGMIYPPEGSKWDSWEEDQPSQRAMLIRSIRETPALTREAIDRSRTWGEVIGYIIRRRDELRAEFDARSRLVEPDEDTPRQAVMSLGQIIARLRDSM